MSPPSSSERVLHLGGTRVAFPGGEATQLYGVLGHPVQHSLSPAMHQAAFDARGIDARYVAFDVGPAALDSFVQDVRGAAATVRGFNVTMPHKTPILSHLDGVDAIALLAGAVNTVVVLPEATLLGSNTDVPGVQEVWQTHDVDLLGGNLVVVGAGGLARASVVAGLRAGVAELRIWNRTPERGQAMLDEILAAWTGPVPRLRCAALSDPDPEWLQDAACLVQATPVGRHPDDPRLLSLDRAAPRLFVLEGLYAASTRLLQDARARGLRCADGRGLLLAQGAASWRHWMQIEPDRQAMGRALGM